MCFRNHVVITCLLFLTQINLNGSITSFTAAGSASKLSFYSSVRVPSLVLYPIRALSAVVVETKRRTLEETAALFDGEDVLNQISITAARQAGVTHDVSLNASLNVNEKDSQ